MNKTSLIIAGIDIGLGLIALTCGQLILGGVMIVVGFLLLLVEG